MKSKKCEMVSNVLLLLGIIFLSITSQSKANEEGSSLNTYIVHVKMLESNVSVQPGDLETWHGSFLPDAAASMVYSYRHVISGFAARLTEEEAKALEKKDMVLRVHPTTWLYFHTTHSPAFLGLHQGFGFWKEANLGEGVIIGVLDSGISPTHPSFSDKGMPPPPARWKGKCEFEGMVCNNKLIGTRTFQRSRTHTEAVPPLGEGHGTLVSAVAAGNFVEGANALGNAKGTAAGVAPMAHLAIYKACSKEGCDESDVLAAFDAAIEDGVDVLSISIGALPFKTFLDDMISVAAFRSVQSGILVTSSAGNIGPFNQTVTNMAPWMLTIGASTTDRMIKATAKLKNGEEFNGESLFHPSNFRSPFLPLVYAGAISSSPYCSPGTLTDADVKGKIVLCEGGQETPGIVKGEEVKNAGGSAMILMNDELDGFTTSAEGHVLPATHVGYPFGLRIKAYINSTSKPKATILFKGTVIGKSNAPMVCSFSSRGPSLASPGILKPDILGPGINILAAWPPVTPENNTGFDSPFLMNSGTSMSSAHLSGVVALLKGSHPEWSPAAIKSAVMTTANGLNLKGHRIPDYTANPANIFATGAGHVNPSKANDPGLVYDIHPNDYIPYLCGINYTDDGLEIITQRPVKCSEVKTIPEAQLNYPSFSVLLGSTPRTLTRIVTNVGQASSYYTLKIVPPEGIRVTVSPKKLIFKELNQKKTYSVTFVRETSSELTGKQFAEGYLKWISHKYTVRSPIVVMFEAAGTE